MLDKKEAPSLVSIIIVTYNAAQFLQNCLNSIYKQTYPAIEIVVLDGGSTDGSVDIIKANDNKIAFWKSEPDEGIYDAMNKALEYIKGDWVYFLGADDIVLEGFSALAYDLEDSNAIYYGSVILRGNKYYGKASKYQLAKSTLCHQAMIYPARVFKKYRFNTRYQISADFELNMRCWRDKSLRFEFRDHTVANFNHTGASSKKDPIFEKEKAALILKNFGFITWLRFRIKKIKQSTYKKPKETED
ncbi:glycosyltransferase family 2 protein [Mucilaginibacter paludis]|uniref:Glycosyl transferase family 2 n=1 Tax=Mucilaginibacter paludis DSM 18603 TaxID=714943 RepID=H1Y2S8_9SPHI|nr:glycosyltransferase family 2 protein [Mucilaginibacter paludis]EHQ28257.1 glycosyl transferase family 2 [Mucilaginibacter paludis DSM 18603]